MSNWKKSFVKLKTVRGWLFDVYPSGSNKMIVWIIAENGQRVKLVDTFTNRIYVSGKFSDLKKSIEKIRDNRSAAGCRLVEKHADFMDAAREKVLEINMKDYRKTSFLARELLKLGGYEKFRLYNVDIPLSQAYLYEKDVFPLAHVLIVDDGKKLCFDILDSVESVDYSVPPLRSMWLNVSTKREGMLRRLSDNIDSISLELDNKTVVLSEGTEKDKILKLVETVKKADPDIIFTCGGDSFLFPYLAYRAFINGVLNRFILSREDIPLKIKKSKGKTFFSYGKIYHKAPMCRLYGRVHVDSDNTFIYTACGLEGLIEVSRTCRVPLQRAARASIGSIMSSLQLYTAWKDNILIPWKKREPESFKSAWELLVADRGGFIFEPKLGFHTDVVEVDFTSMFPMLMLKRNISGETVLCKCCPDSRVNVPELGYNICERRRGIVPKTLDLLLRKRLKYKNLMRDATNEKRAYVYNMRQAALKWILVTCFGYLGYRNARFGKVDAHIAVCAFARDALLKTAMMAEEHGFEVIHGIVDSLWLKKIEVSPKDVVEFCRKISKIINVSLNVEGKYRWIVFLPSKVLKSVPVLNRYYGVFENGRIKMRGIEARRRDTPRFISKVQVEMIKKIAKSFSFEDFLVKLSTVLNVLRKHAAKLISNQVDTKDLLITKRLSKSPSGYSHDVFQCIAAKQLEKAGFEVSAGQTIRYLIVDFKSRTASKRILAAELLTSKTRYDAQKYLDMLISSSETLFGIFGYTKDKIREALHHQK